MGKGQSYGGLRVGTINNGDRRTESAHRFSWNIHFGEIPKGLFVCHSCDVPLCVNPEHLFLGTAQDNHRDSMKKGRSNPKFKNPNAKVTFADVINIRRSSKSVRELSEIYGLSYSQIFRIRRGESW